jgi:hypothetical protein
MSTPRLEFSTSAQEAILSDYCAFNLHETWHVSTNFGTIFTFLKKLQFTRDLACFDQLWNHLHGLQKITMNLQSSNGTFVQYSFQIITIKVFEH